MKAMLAVVVTVVILNGTVVRSEAATLGEIFGTASKLYSAVSGLAGTTEVTPAYAIHYWTARSWGIYGGVPYGHVYVIQRDILGNYSYFRRSIWDGTTYYESTETFPLHALQRYNYRCDAAPDNPGTYVYNELEDFTLAVWVGRLVKTGSFPPGEPYRAWIKSVGTRVRENCNPPPVFSREFRSSVLIYDTGTSTIKPGWVGYAYSFPFLCWVGDCYDY